MEGHRKGLRGHNPILASIGKDQIQCKKGTFLEQASHLIISKSGPATSVYKVARTTSSFNNI